VTELETLRHSCAHVLAEAILRLGAGDLAAMGARGRDWMIRDFAPEAMVAGFSSLYRNLVTGEPQMVNA
jgi:threonyl-tRNA synthetase